MNLELKQLRIGTKGFEIIEIGVEEGIDLGSRIKDSMLFNLVLQGKSFFRLMLCKWMMSLANSTWDICQ